MEIDVKLKTENLRRKIESYTRLKTSVKKMLDEKLGIISRFIKVGPGVVSPEKVRKTLGDVRSLLGIWVRDTETVKDWYELIDEIKGGLFPEDFEKETVLGFINEEKKDEEERILEKRDMDIESSDEINSIAAINQEINKRYRSLYPENLEKLDICYLPIGVIPHYCLVYKVLGPITYVISLTSNKKKEFIGHVIEKSRFFKGSTATYSLHQVPTSMALKMYVMPFDSKTEGNTILKECTEYLSTNIIIKTRKLCKRKK